jgi:hypothetical protein
MVSVSLALASAYVVGTVTLHFRELDLGEPSQFTSGEAMQEAA